MHGLILQILAEMCFSTLVLHSCAELAGLLCYAFFPFSVLSERLALVDTLFLCYEVCNQSSIPTSAVLWGPVPALPIFMLGSAGIGLTQSPQYLSRNRLNW